MLPIQDRTRDLSKPMGQIVVPGLIIGFLRTLLSVWATVIPELQMLYTPGEFEAGFHPLFIVLLMLVLSFLPDKWLYVRDRLTSLMVAGAVAAVACLGVNLLPSPGILSAACFVVIDLYIAYLMRVWGDDNVTSSLERVIIILGVSFLAQYIAYSFLVIVPVEVRVAAVALLPPMIAWLSSGRRPPSTDLDDISGSRTCGSPIRRNAMTVVTICLCVSAHAVLFCIPGSNTVIWVVAPLMIFILILGCWWFVSDSVLFKATVCVTLLLQCVFIVPSIITQFSPALLTTARSLSYSATMLLTMMVGCWFGALDSGHGGRTFCRWLLLYFVSFYAVRYLFVALNVEPVFLSVLMLAFLVIAALPMIASDWATSPSVEGPMAATDDLDDAGLLDNACDGIARSYALTQREAEVLRLIAGGASSGEAAADLQVSQNTVKTQIQAIYRKLGVHNRTELGAMVEGYR